jgi:hypothetical protein
MIELMSSKKLAVAAFLVAMVPIGGTACGDSSGSPQDPRTSLRQSDANIGNSPGQGDPDSQNRPNSSDLGAAEGPGQATGLKSPDSSPPSYPQNQETAPGQAAPAETPQGVPRLSIGEITYTRGDPLNSICTLSLRVYNNGTADAENVSVHAKITSRYVGNTYMEGWMQGHDFVDSDFFSWYSLRPGSSIEPGAAVTYAVTVFVAGQPVASASNYTTCP